jgi:hypothetical protein
MTTNTGETLFDRVTLVCRRCKAEHTTFLQQPLRTKDLKGWLDTNVFKFCNCPDNKCDVKFRIKDSQ